jgi:hypothetical protein
MVGSQRSVDQRLAGQFDIPHPAPALIRLGSAFMQELPDLLRNEVWLPVSGSSDHA